VTIVQAGRIRSSALLAVLALLALSACSAVQDAYNGFAAYPLITHSLMEKPIPPSDDPLRPSPIDLDTYWFRDGSSNVTAYAAAAADPVKRNRLLYVLMDHSDRLCERYTADMLATRNLTTFSLSTLATAFSGAASIVAGVAGQALSGASTAASATRTAMAEEVYQKAVITDITRTIKETRAKYRNSISEKLLGPVNANNERVPPGIEVYSVDEAIGDALQYHAACGFTSALDNLAKGAAQAPAPPDASGKTIDATGARVAATPPTVALAVRPQAAEAQPGLAGPRVAVVAAPPLPPAQQVGGAQGADEQSLTPAQGRRIQAALCLTPDGKFLGDTRDAIRQFRRARGIAANSPTLAQPLSHAEILSLLAAGPCTSPIGHLSAYERFRFPTADRIKALQAAINARADNPPRVTEDGTMVSTRAAIQFLNNKCGLGASDRVTPELIQALATTCR
jgi:hypothetical protein